MTARTALALVASLFACAGTASYAQDEAALCAAMLPKLQALATESAAFLETVKAELPADLWVVEPSHYESVVRDARSSSQQAIAGPVGDMAVALIWLRDPLAEYAKQVGAAAVAVEACAAAR